MSTFDSILIANRGEIVTRVARTARTLGFKTIAVASDADRHAPHTQACDTVVGIGGERPADSYLRIDTLMAAARAGGAQAVHPGYGFLSENAAFAQAVMDAGLVWIGPPPAAMTAMADKARAKQRMAAAGVPVLPGAEGDDQSPETLRAAALRVGLPLMIKATAGGGGRGMRLVTDLSQLDAALASAAAEALAAFGDARLLIERALLAPRHVEIQVFADTHGHVIHLGERDCSVQRRHQKIIEEAPSPAVSPELRRRMGEVAVTVAREVGYVGAGTVEFLLDMEGSERGHFWFMEMNTRLQVEHPVTEAITGLDLVEWQLRVASGEPLPLRQDELRIHGHAIEARICAENPDANFLPATGRLEVYRTPDAVSFERGRGNEGGAACAPVRVDAGVREGDAISPYYDSMIAKLIVWGADRAQALARLDAALAQTHIVGLHTNVAFLRRVAASPSFANADLDTALIERERAVLFNAAPLPIEVAAAGVVAHALAAERVLEGADPWSRRDGWRLHGSAARRFDIEAQGTHHGFSLERSAGAQTLVQGAQRWPFAVSERSPGLHDVALDGRRWSLHVYATGERFSVFAPEGSAVVDEFDPIAHSADGAKEAGGLAAPMPGKVIAFLAKAGDRVTEGQPLAVMEAMKMEHTIAAPRDGTIAELLYAVGDQVSEGGELLRMAPAV
jgi:3-methylcrotonyl-CoA carboxylase alpha subunit